MRNFGLMTGLLTLLGCEGGVGVSVGCGYGDCGVGVEASAGTDHGSHHHSYGHPQVTNAFAYCTYDYGYADYVWEFEASVSHSYDISHIANVWVDVYEGPHLVYSDDLWLEQSDPYGNMSYWHGWTTEHHTYLYCGSHHQYTIETIALDYEGNYSVAVEYLY